MNLKTRLSLIVILLVSISLFSQEKQEISGTVSDVANNPLPGVNVIVANTSRGTTTDFDGNFQLEVSVGEVIEFSSLGYVTKSISITDQKQLTIALEEDASQLEEVVVVGYGSVKKSDITGSVSSIKADELTAYPVSNAEQALQGRAAGVVVQSNNGGEPGAPISIKIRGNTSIGASSSPLVVVDGFVGATMPQANDIASMEVLKDASATAIYGSRGSNGVIMVTTKKGRKGKISVELNTTYAVQNTANSLDLLNASDFVDYQNEIRANQGNTTPFPDKGFDTDWQDLIYEAGNTQNYQLSFSGGSDKINFYASSNYYSQDGVIINSDYEKLTFLSNIEAQVSDKVKLGMNLTGSRDTKNGVPTQSTGANGIGGGGDDVISLAMRFAPDQPIQNADGSYTFNDAVGDPIDNPYAVATLRTDETKTDDFRVNTFLAWDIIENLEFKTTFGYSTRNRTQGLYVPSTLQISASAVGGRASIENRRNTTLLSENYLTWKKELGKGNLVLLGGYSYQKNVNEMSFTAGTGLISDSFVYHGLGTATGLLQPDSSITTTEVQSLFARVNYDWADKYLITATVRRDGASNFAENEKYAIFPSAAFGWKISNEDFLKDSNTVSNLKLRLSYGVTGNPSIAAYQSLARFESLYAASNGETVSAITPDQPANPDLKWESSYQTNVGVDFGMFNSALNLSLDYYNIDTKDLILGNNGTPEYFGFLNDEILTNLGEINNSGFEVSIDARIFSKEDFTWRANFNWSTNKNKVESLVNDKDLFFDGTPSYFSLDDSTILRVGEEVGLFWGYDYAGVFQGGTAPTGTATLPGGVAGDPLFHDIDDSGDITESDKTIIGNPNANSNWGFNNDFRYKDFDLNIFFQASTGGDIFNMTNVQLMNGDGNTLNSYYDNAWRSDNTDTNQPRVGNNSFREISSRFVEDGSYVRLKNMAIGYNIPSEVLEKSGFSGVRFSISGQNLWTITDYSGLDPEVNFEGTDPDSNISSNTLSGYDFGNYPTVRSFSFSVNLKF